MSSADVDDIATVPYFLVLLDPGPNRAAEPQHRTAHIAFIETMEAANVVLLGGEFGSLIDGAQAAYLLHVSSQSEAENWAASDPLIVEKVFQARVVAWHLVGIASAAIDPTFRT
ncbi:MAG: YciI family protein [Gemmatimonadaceae bacterium]